MTSSAADAVIAQLVFQRHIHRAGYMTLQIRCTPVGFVEPPAHVENGRRRTCFDEVRQLGSGNEDLSTCHASHFQHIAHWRVCGKAEASAPTSRHGSAD